MFHSQKISLLNASTKKLSSINWFIWLFILSWWQILWLMIQIEINRLCQFHSCDDPFTFVNLDARMKSAPPLQSIIRIDCNPFSAINIHSNKILKQNKLTQKELNVFQLAKRKGEPFRMVKFRLKWPIEKLAIWVLRDTKFGPKYRQSNRFQFVYRVDLDSFCQWDFGQTSGAVKKNMLMFLFLFLSFHFWMTEDRNFCCLRLHS